MIDVFIGLYAVGYFYTLGRFHINTQAFKAWVSNPPWHIYVADAILALLWPILTLAVGVAYLADWRDARRTKRDD